MSNKLYVPQIENKLDMLSRFEYRHYGHSYTYDEKSYKLLDEIFELLKKIQPHKNGNQWTLWFKADRGPIEAFGNYEEYKEWGDVETYEEFEELWRDYYPNEEKWYCFQALYDKEINYRAIFMKNKHIIEYENEIQPATFPYEISDFVEWMLESVKECIEMMQDGTYNDYVNKNLPARVKSGTICLKDYWDIFPEERQAHYEDISKEEIAEYLTNILHQRKEPEETNNKLPVMCANDFFRFCAIGYKAMGYEGSELPPKEQYLKHADGRDGGLCDIAPDSTDAFKDWIESKEYHGCHPWEVCRGGNSTHIDLYVYNQEDGYVLLVAGSSFGRSNEAVKMYNALKREGLPVYMSKGDLIAARLREEEMLGIVPEGVIPKYCESWFPGEEVITFLHLPYEKEKDVILKTKWHLIEKTELVGANYENI